VRAYAFTNGADLVLALWSPAGPVQLVGLANLLDDYGIQPVSGGIVRAPQRIDWMGNSSYHAWDETVDLAEEPIYITGLEAP
jgi:hypothetical protein